MYSHTRHVTQCLNFVWFTVVSHPEGGPVSLLEGTSENGDTSTGDDGEIEALGTEWCVSLSKYFYVEHM